MKNYNNNNNGTTKPSTGFIPYVNSEEGLIEAFQVASWVLAGICSFLACVVSFRLINSHLTYFNEPRIQRKIVGILWIVPIFAIDSWLSLRFIKASVYLDMFRDCYEAYVIHLFLSLMINYLSKEYGGEHLFLDHLDATFNSVVPSNEKENNKQLIHHMFPFKYCLQDWKLDRTFILKCKQGTIQFVVLKPLLT